MPERATLGQNRWMEAASLFDDGIGDKAKHILEQDSGIRVLNSLFGNSPYLTECALRDLPFCCDLLMAGADETLRWTEESMAGALAENSDEKDVARILRQAKRRIALTTALADLASDWSLDKVTGVLSGFADSALRAAINQILRDAVAQGRFECQDPTDPAKDSGFIIIGMGKLGARELNYSSDIDLIVLYDQDKVTMNQPDDMQRQFVRMTRALVRIIDERTADGYVFRTDLRLRPDPGSTPIAISVLAAETYYESIGQNWERAAMIKARPVAGDLDAGADYLARLQPFIWRRNLDFATINDIHSIKRQINAHRGGSGIDPLGHNIKLGRGGIREIEFFTQTQQLIWGGREPELRRQRTVEALDSLRTHGRISQQAQTDLQDAYEFLRDTEHRLQMIEDRQTQTLPDDRDGMQEFAVFMGFSDREAFSSHLTAQLRIVETHYAALFKEEKDLSAQGAVQGNLVFTGSDPDPDTLRTLRDLGFKTPEAVDTAVRGWHHARYRATSTTRARQILTELMPVLLKAQSGTADPDKAFFQFDQFLSRLPAGVQLFSMFHAHPELLELVAEIMGTAPRLAQHLSRNPALLEGVLSTDADDVIAGIDELSKDFSRRLAGVDNFEDILDEARRWTNDRKFLIGIATMRGSLHPLRAAECYSDLADTVIGHLMEPVHAAFAARHGQVPGSEMAVLAMGKLGSQEMTPTSDLDLIFIYSQEGVQTQSDGQRPLPIQQYYSRLSQRCINALTVPTSEGALYEVDMRLRPSGNAGPIACSMDSFHRYQDEEAWTWEHMALTRARPIVGSPQFRAAIAQVVHDVITRPRDPEKLRHEVADMRRRMDKEHHSDFIWETKHRRGGLVDIEFICQYLLLRHGAEHPQLAGAGTRDCLLRLAQAGLLPPEEARELIAALDLWQTIQGILRLTIEGMFGAGREKELSGDLKSLLCTATSHQTFQALLDDMARAADAVLNCYRRLIEPADG